MPRFPNSTNSSSSNNQNRYNPYSNNIRSLGSKSSNNTNSTITTSVRSLSTSQQVQPSPTNNLNIRYNSSGYRQFLILIMVWGGNSPTEELPKRRLEVKLYVHHINKNKTDNRYGNLAVLDGAIHQHLHNSKSEKTACFRCGRTSHHASQCFANSDVFGRSVVGSGSRTSYYSDDESSSDDDSYGGCSRCGRSSHTSSNCYARSDRYEL
ncbi:predicted protein [Naegleria gruberi]|uniref:Predicted protein n=1 Tax=Naegleria gruberi TaxID=5762 RepID=D2VI87_NAEGR|nr:uncharacterized protein NAEGRDRAFT_49766 [Naegleria gruberi]EFC43554.1 predicted protein [Naegleria gruberi]|eukprot:XP_002676298.1 predicted protein [Naegleria gruberi strain NEG-M]